MIVHLGLQVFIIVPQEVKYYVDLCDLVLWIHLFYSASYYYYYFYYYNLFFYVFFDVTLLPVFYTNREPFGKMLTLIDFAFGKKKKRKLSLLLEKHLSNNDYDYEFLPVVFTLFY